jgi:serine protease Do
MMRCCKVGLLVLLASLGAGAGSAQGPSVKADLEVCRQLAEKAEPAIACVLVTRTQLYQKVGQAAADAAQGKLGGFDPAQVAARRDLDEAQRGVLLERLDMAQPRYVPEAFGSGVVIDAKGLILTNYHVVRDATKVFIRLPGGKAGYADIHAADPRSDLAVLRLRDAKLGPLEALSPASAGKFHRGQSVVVLAQPFLAKHAKPVAVPGRLADERRRILVWRKEEDFKSLHQHGSLWQIDAKTAPESGGAVLDLKGRFIGLTTAWPVAGGPVAGGCAVPFDERFARIVEVLQRGEEVEYGFLGIGLGKDRDLAGVIVAQVYDRSPAERDAKLSEGDQIVSVNGQPIRDSEDLFLFLGGHLAGTRVRLEYVRPGLGKKATEATLVKYWTTGKVIYSSLGKRPFVRGLRVDDASVLAQQPPRWPVIPPGVVISDIEAGSAADKAKLKAGDVITRIGDTAVTTPADFYRVMASRKGPVTFALWGGSGPGPKVEVK